MNAVVLYGSGIIHIIVIHDSTLMLCIVQALGIVQFVPSRSLNERIVYYNEVNPYPRTVYNCMI